MTSKILLASNSIVVTKTRENMVAYARNWSGGNNFWMLIFMNFIEFSKSLKTYASHLSLVIQI